MIGQYHREDVYKDEPGRYARHRLTSLFLWYQRTIEGRHRQVP